MLVEPFWAPALHGDREANLATARSMRSLSTGLRVRPGRPAEPARVLLDHNRARNGNFGAEGEVAVPMASPGRSSYRWRGRRAWLDGAACVGDDVGLHRHRRS